MEPLSEIRGIAAPLDMINVDTDMIIPKQYLKTIRRTGLGRYLFDEMSHDENGAERPDFILNRAPWREARILIAGENFGCGSSREHAPWALTDFGIRCVIAPSFADIFYNNCFQNALLPAILPAARCAELMAVAARPESAEMTVDLESRTLRHAAGDMPFEIAPHRRARLMAGLDDIALTLGRADEIAAYEARAHAERPWLFS